MTTDEITALAIVLQAHTAAFQLPNMELRSMLEFMRARGFLVQPKAVA